MEDKEIPRKVTENQLNRFLDDSITELNTYIPAWKQELGQNDSFSVKSRKRKRQLDRQRVRRRERQRERERRRLL